MIPAIALFAITYILMLTFSKYRPYIALASGAIFIISGMLPLDQIIGSLDFNVLLMIAGTMGLVQLFIDSKMPNCWLTPSWPRYPMFSGRRYAWRCLPA